MRGLNRPPHRGFSLVELLVALVVAGLVLAGVATTLLGAQRFYRAQAQVLEVQQNVRVIAQVLSQELRGLDSGDGDIVAMSDTAITFKAPRVFSVTCAAPDVARGVLVVRNSLSSGFRAVDPARDSVLVFRDGDPRIATDDLWLRSSLSATGAAACADGAAGSRLTLSGAAGGLAQLDGVSPGSPVRARGWPRRRQARAEPAVVGGDRGVAVPEHEHAVPRGVHRPESRRQAVPHD